MKILTSKTGAKISEIVLEFEVMNALTAPKQTAMITLRSPVKELEEE